MPEKKEFTFEIKKHIETLSGGQGKWAREVNVVSWNGAKPKLDIRDWSPDHSKMGKGVSLTSEEVALLKEILSEYDPYSTEEL
ncbi:YdbC family protein [Mageeibacillus indolicus]|jgi:hypothetical protein|uniref:Transcriptional coactivator p15 (PC4) C-terminal domain-containing protein n=2 Tax=Mageeibacillus indolicus TaxID=884684 RepID=D3R1D0_MAGIU|nr:PC4/YdbC family ssDNA-binding protein [Mageeibacillus indolicus]ADC90527.1 hypothetical protein HMPREF0868_0665 [Mageeibacillus indolicus UPII9-5]KFA57606.1 hypothetical protein HMPREF1632_03015 [Mageeibacillus indolicus 0009-5]PNH19490.1 hypothetical protein B7R76_00975 [Mageeibacillus indolicus]